MATENPHVLLEMSDEPDCRFVATWSAKRRKLRPFGHRHCKIPNLMTIFSFFTATVSPISQPRHIEILGELEHHRHVASLDLYQHEDGLFSIEFVMLVQLGFFVVGGSSYWMAISRSGDAHSGEAGGFGCAINDRGLGWPRDTSTRASIAHVVCGEANAWRLRLIMMRRFGTERKSRVRGRANPAVSRGTRHSPLRTNCVILGSHPNEPVGCH